jgi:hypothetical protein
MWKYLQDNKIDIPVKPDPGAGLRLCSISISTIWPMWTLPTRWAWPLKISILSYIDNAPAFTKYKIAIEDKMVNEERFERIAKRFATYEYPENVEANDILSITIEELNADGSLKEGGISTVSSVMMDLIKKDQQADFLALTKGASIEKNVWDIIGSR